MMGQTTFMSLFLPASALLLFLALIFLFWGIRKKRTGFLAASTALGVVLLGAWGLLGIFITGM